LTLDDVPVGERVFIDSTIFIYHFTGASLECKKFLERCERGQVKGISSVIVLAEVAHRLMMIEAVARKLVSGRNIAKKLRSQPQIVKKLHVYQEQIERIPLMGIKVEDLGMRIVLSSEEIRRKHGLLVNDSLIAATARAAGVGAIATADSDFEGMKELDCFVPSDIVAI
jgi:predicted nucleic acid-binding protein